MLHIDGSKHSWFADGCYYDLIVIMDDATNEIYYAQLVEEESTFTVMAALREVIETKRLCCSLYSDRASHFFLTPKAGEPVTEQHLTQVGRALTELGIRPIPAYSPQTRGCSERNFGTWQGRLPQELRIRSPKPLAEANEFLRPPTLPSSIRSSPCQRKKPGQHSSLIAARTSTWSSPCKLNARWRATTRSVTTSTSCKSRRRSGAYTLSGCKVKVYEHTDGTLSIGYSPHLVGRYSAEGTPLADVPKQRQSNAPAKKKQAKLPRKNRTGPAVEMTPLRKATKRVASLRGLEKSRQKAA